MKHACTHSLAARVRQDQRGLAVDNLDSGGLSLCFVVLGSRSEVGDGVA